MEGDKKHAAPPGAPRPVLSGVSLPSTINPGRLQSIRPNPATTLGGVKKPEFKPKVPAQPHVPRKVEIKQEQPDVSARATDQGQRRPPAGRGRPLDKDKRHVSFGPTTTAPSSQGAMFGAGPPPAAVSAVRRRESEDVGEDKKTAEELRKSNEMHIDPFDPLHPLVLPMFAPEPELPRARLKSEDAMEVDLEEEFHASFLRDNELCLVQLPSALPVITVPREPIKTDPDAKQTPKPAATGAPGAKPGAAAAAGSKAAPAGAKSPVAKASAAAAGATAAGAAAKSSPIPALPPPPDSMETPTTQLKDIPEGHLGKMLFYKSGKVKFKIGDFVYDVLPGTETTFLQQVMSLNPQTKQCFQLGDLRKQLIIVPDVEHLLGSIEQSEHSAPR